MLFAPDTSEVQNIDVQLFHAVENNAIDCVARLLRSGANPHALIPVSLSQFRSSFRQSKVTHLTPTFRALHLYHDDAILGRLMAGTQVFPRVPAAYAFVDESGHDIRGDKLEINGAPVVVVDLLVGMSELERIAPDNRAMTAEMISMRLDAGGASSLYCAGDVACDHIARFLSCGKEVELERALALFNTGAQVRGDEAGWQALARMRGMTRQSDRKNSIEVSLPIMAMFLTGHQHRDVGARLIAMLLKNHAIDPDYRERGLPLLHWAAYLDDAISIDHLLSHGANSHAYSSPNSELATDPVTADEIADLAGNETSASVLRAFNARTRVQSVLDLIKHRVIPANAQASNCAMAPAA